MFQNSAQRVLAAIVLTDAVSFSARMSVDEEGTLMLIQRDLTLIAELCDRYGGRVLKSMGDGLLMSFYSAVQAVRCSQEIQQELAKRTEGLAPEDYLQHRIGIHLGDVVLLGKSDTSSKEFDRENDFNDVFGNGVNIAARLQTYSAPGGICISQTIHDVVKARLDINATFLGPLQLKNIREPVPAFQIPPVGQSATLVVGHSLICGDAEETDALTLAVQTLERDSQHRRIKKLLFGTSQRIWENSPAVLAQYELLALLEKLFNRYRSLAALEEALRSVVLRLNHKTEYMAVVDTILEVLDPVYRQRTDASDGEAEPIITEEQVRYRAVAANLDQQTDQLRIKKLLYAIIHTAWENDAAVLEQQSMEELVVAVHQMAPTESDLSYHLERIVRRLNRQSRYTQVALVISEAFLSLYGLISETSLIPADPTALESSVEDTIMSGGEPIRSDEGLTSVTQVEQRTHLPGDVTAPPVSTPIYGGGNAGAPAKPRDRANLFRLRMEIMRYTNPLRAKILLLSTVRSPFTFSQQDWITLKSKTLDDLIQSTFDYCTTYADLESKLTIMCHCVESLEDNLQTAGAILQAMKAFYA